MKDVIKIENVSFSYNRHLVLEDVNLKVEEKDFVGIIGPNGGGKTTLIRLILGFLKPIRGSVTVLGGAPDRMRRHVGYVPQYFEPDRNFPIRVADVVAMGTMSRSALLPWFGKDDRERVRRAMSAVGVGDLADRTFSEISMGQRQRCLIARALVSHPKLLILDEPTASVDMTAEKDIYEFLHEINDEVTILLASHDVNFISKYVNRVVCVNRLAACHLSKDVSAELIQNLYESEVAMMQHRCEL